MATPGPGRFHLELDGSNVTGPVPFGAAEGGRVGPRCVK